jgi:transposase
LEISARGAANEINLDYRVVHKKFMEFRKLISKYCDNQVKELNGELELDESYFGGKRKGNRGRGAFNKAIVFGILERKGKIYTKIVPNVQKDTLMDAIKNKTKKDSVFYTDTWKSYNSLHQFGKHNKDEFAKDKNHINGIEEFWSYAKNHRNEKVFNLLFNICIRRLVGPE